MQKHYFFLWILLCFASTSMLQGQTVDSLKRDTTANNMADSIKAIGIDSLGNIIKAAAQDTSKKETRAERKIREKAEKERAKYYYKDILKDSSRLEIERLSRVAWRRSLAVPGWGQYTNGRLWWIKVPIIYGGFVTAYMVFDYWNWYYQKFLKEAQYRVDNNEATSDPELINIGTPGLIRSKDNYRRYRDITVVATVGLWGLNVVEAYVNSMLKHRYYMGDLSFKVTPTFMPSSNMGYHASLVNQFAPGIKLTMNIH